MPMDKSVLSKLTIDEDRDEESLDDLKEMEFVPFQIRINKWFMFYLCSKGFFKSFVGNYRNREF